MRPAHISFTSWRCTPNRRQFLTVIKKRQILPVYERNITSSLEKWMSVIHSGHIFTNWEQISTRSSFMCLYAGIFVKKCEVDSTFKETKSATMNIFRKFLFSFIIICKSRIKLSFLNKYVHYSWKLHGKVNYVIKQVFFSCWLLFASLQ